MNKQTVSTLVLCLLATPAAFSGKRCCCGSCGLDKKIDSFFAPFSQTKMMKDNFNKLFESKEIRFTNYDNAIKINLTLGQGIKVFEGDADDNQLIIKIPEINKQIIVSYDAKARFLSVSQAEKKDRKKKTKKGYYQESVTCSSMKQGVTVHNELELEKASFEYKDDTLTISIPKKIAPKKERKKITVTMKP